MSVRDYSPRALVNPLERWKHESTMKIYLASAPPPRRDLDLKLVSIQLRLTQMRIRDIEAVLGQLKRRSYEIETVLTDLYIVRQDLGCKLFPINTLPTELITKIFRMAIFTPPFATSMQRVLSISWVCQRWRAVALADRMLWGSLQFQDAPDFQLTHVFMERAGDVRLDVRINECMMRCNPDGTPFVFTAEHMHALMELLLPKAAQIRKLIVEVADPIVALLPLHKLRHSPLVALERLDLRRSSPSSNWIPSFTLPLAMRQPVPLGKNDLPHMTFLILDGVAVNWEQTQFRNLRQLELFSLADQQCPTLQQWSAILEGSPALYKIALDGAGPQVLELIPQRSVSKVRLPLLRSLILGSMSQRIIQIILDSIDAPGLMDLLLFNLTRADRGPLAETLIGRFPQVKLLGLYHVEIFPTAANLKSLVLWFESMPKLCMLKVATVCPIVTDALLQKPASFHDQQQDGTDSEAEILREASRTSDVVCPTLQALQFSAADQECATSLVGNRRLMGKGLRSVYVHGEELSKLTPTTVSALHKYAHRFLTVTQHGGERAPEEEEIHREMMLSSPGPSIYSRF